MSVKNYADSIRIEREPLYYYVNFIFFSPVHSEAEVGVYNDAIWLIKDNILIRMEDIVGLGELDLEENKMAVVAKTTTYEFHYSM